MKKIRSFEFNSDRSYTPADKTTPPIYASTPSNNRHQHQKTNTCTASLPHLIHTYYPDVTNGSSSCLVRSGSPIIDRCLRGCDWGVCVVDWLVMPVSDILVSPMSVTLFSLDPPVNKPKCVDMTRDVTEDSQTNIDEQVTAAACDKPSSRGWEENGHNDKDDVRSFDHCDILLL